MTTISGPASFPRSVAFRNEGYDMKQSRARHLVCLLGTLSACSSTVELERPIPGAAGSATAGASASCRDAICPELTLETERVRELLSDGTRLYWVNGQYQVRGCIAQRCGQSVISYGIDAGYVGT